MTRLPDIPNPGSDEAVKQGCTCPRMDNGWGRGVYLDEKGEMQFWISEDCPLHSDLKKEAKNE